MATIKQIDAGTVHRIQSGQVIVDLCSVVKELVENSVDAGATSIDVRFRNQGLDLIEVQDNGSGISPANYAAVALKHHTSKLSSYSDIATLETFGFRGEALSSLCALSILSVTTCQAADVPKGSRLTFKPSGELNGTSIVAAQKGTTVSVERLFHNLPVRRRELERNIKREWHKVIGLLNQYACIQTNLKFSVSQQPTKGKRILLFSTKGNQNTRENIINIFGAKTMTVLVPLNLHFELQPSTAGRGTQTSIDANGSRDVRIVGHVSRPAHGEGRQTPDRQMFFVNGRPCGLPQFAKAFNEVYRSYNSSQSPFIMADIQLDTHMYDVNVSPDKRSILLHDQNDLLESLRASLTELFESQDYSVPTGQLVKLKGSQQGQDSKRSISPALPRHQLTHARSAPSPDSDIESGSESTEDESTSRERGSSRNRAIKTPQTSRSLLKNGQSLISGWMNPNAMSSSGVTGASLSSKLESTPSKAPPSAATIDQGNARLGTPIDEGKPIPVRDFNRRLLELNGASDRGTGKMRSSSPSLPAEDDGHDDAPIPSLPITKATEPDSPEVVKISWTSRPISGRSAPADAKIVIGDDDVTSMLTSPPKHTLPNLQRNSTHGAGGSAHIIKPDIRSRLSQFSAGGGTTGGGLDVGEASEDDEHENESVTSNQSGDSRADEDYTTVVERTRKLPQEDELSDSLFVSDDPDVDADELRADVPPEVSEDASPQDPAAVQKEPILKTEPRKKHSTVQTTHSLRVNERLIQDRMSQWHQSAIESNYHTSGEKTVTDLSAVDAEEKLSLIISKGDFLKMRIAGQFNLGFIIAIRPAKRTKGDDIGPTDEDELFIIDQHATDEKYNFERLQATTVVQSQRLVHPMRLELTALEEEIVMQNMSAIEANGFKVHVDTSGDEPVGSRCQILSLPLSRETTFNLADFEELVSLLGDESCESKHVPRPSKVRKMFAMRACRSSIMIGKALTQGQMETLVRHMGELDKPWNCPHGRPTMRHLCKLQPWDDSGWRRDTTRVSPSAWASYVNSD